MRKKSLVVKSNSLIEASFKLTATEQKIIAILVSMIQPEDKEFKSYKIKIKDLMEVLEINHNDYDDLIESSKNLMKKVFEIKESKGLLVTSWLSSFYYLSAQGEVELSFDPKLKPYLLDLKAKFTKYRIQNVIQLKSSYSIRIYELLKQYERIGERVFNVDSLKSTLGINLDDYKNFNDFKKRVIEPAKKEITEKTDILFDYEEIKRGRKVQSIKFNITSKKKIEELPAKLKEDNQELIEKMRGYGLKESKIKDIIIKYDEQYILENFVAIDKGINSGEVKSIPAYVLSALRDDYRLQKSPFEIEIEQQKEEKKRQIDEGFKAALEQAAGAEADVIDPQLSNKLKSIKKKAKKG